MFANVRREFEASFSDWSGGALSALLIAIGLTYVAIGVFVQSKPIKLGAAAYGLLP